MRTFTRQDLLPRVLALVLLVFLFVLTAVCTPAYAIKPAQVNSIEDLWIDMSIGPPLIPLFNQIARGDDIARVEHPSQAPQLSGINTGRKMVIFKSIAETEQFLQESSAEIDIIGYNLEHNPVTPASEQADPVSSIKQMRDLADKYELELAFGPDHDFALSHGVEVAPFVDIFVLQIQRQQTNPAVVEEFVVPLVPRLRGVNPDLEISVQVRTEGDVAAILELLDSLKAHLDGVSILTSPDTVAVAEELVAGLRPSASQSTGYILPALLLIGLLAGGALLIRRRRTDGS